MVPHFHFVLEYVGKSSGLTRESNSIIYSLVIILPLFFNILSYILKKNSRYLDQARNNLFLLSPFIFISDENSFERLALVSSWLSIYYLLQFILDMKPKLAGIGMVFFIAITFYISLYLFPQITTQISVFDL